MKNLLVLLPLGFSFLATLPAIAGSLPEKSVPCYFFRGDRVELKQTCTHVAGWGTGAGGAALTWQDRVVTRLAWENDELSLDGNKAFSYARDRKTLRRLPSDEAKRLRDNGASALSCWQTYKYGNSVCWIR
ncbi:MAG: hypothetical protein KME13_11275 [Myxacorys californica WJT36-NPBG1]|nr:hypothetical protein [Myxacorys californica WJT36-NPBG1]